MEPLCRSASDDIFRIHHATIVFLLDEPCSSFRCFFFNDDDDSYDDDFYQQEFITGVVPIILVPAVLISYFAKSGEKFKNQCIKEMLTWYSIEMRKRKRKSL